ncbi:hypothetical protein [Novipirellula rosea]|uniref:hypothetical protein n=1 Tax=Novipirellula rosea TaxID=1031540 RepID=UPI0031E8265D
MESAFAITRFGKEKLAKSVVWNRFRPGCGGLTAKVIAHSHGHTKQGAFRSAESFLPPSCIAAALLLLILCMTASQVNASDGKLVYNFA